MCYSVPHKSNPKRLSAGLLHVAKRLEIIVLYVLRLLRYVANIGCSAWKLWCARVALNVILVQREFG